MITNTVKQIIRYQHIKNWYEKYERILLPATLVFGVLLDAFTFTTINITSTFILLGIYFFLAAGTILFVQAYDAKRLKKNRLTEYFRLASPLIIQLTFGALLSGVFIFYFFSGTLFVSWPFLFILVLLMVSNDVFKKYYARTTIQLGVFYFIVFSLCSIIVSFLTESLSAQIFLVAGALSLLCMFGYNELLLVANKEGKKFRMRFAVMVVSIFLLLNALYFAKIIPPIPLSIREMTLAHNVSSSGGTYSVQVEQQSWWQRLLTAQTFHKSPSDTVYVYTAIFAPGKLQTKIVHDWQHYDEVHNKWVSLSKLSFTLTGGRKEGFRGYSLKTNVPAGKWRVYVETERGQVLGRMRFRVQNVAQSPELTEVRK